MNGARRFGFRRHPLGRDDRDPLEVVSAERVAPGRPSPEAGSDYPSPGPLDLSLEDVRAVPIDKGTAEMLEAFGFELVRAGDFERGNRILTVALAWRFSPSTSPSVVGSATVGNDRVVELHKWSGKVDR